MTPELTGLDFRNSYFDGNALPLQTNDANKVISQMKNEDLKDLLFQIELDLKSIEGQIFASKYRYHEKGESQSAWYAKTKSVEALKQCELMAIKREVDRRYDISVKKALLEVKDLSDSVEFLRKFHRAAKYILSSATYKTLLLVSTDRGLDE